MRVTNKMMIDNALYNVMKNSEELYELQGILASNKKINKPSDNPLDAVRILNYRGTMNSLEQYQKNIDQANSWLSYNESILGSIDSLIVKSKELAVTQSSTTASDSTRETSAELVKNIREQIISYANSQWRDRYLFGGYQTQNPPFQSDGSFLGDNGVFQVPIDKNVSLVINIDGSQLFKSGVDIFQTLQEFETALRSNDTATIRNKITELNSFLDQVISARAEVGVKVNRLDSTKSSLDNRNFTITEQLSSIENADMAYAITQYESQYLTYEASLTSATKVMQTNIVDYLR
ncbi:MAG: flagellar hook-associated protein FlgL [Thermodesulfobacteriota bacterium]|nr:flagellar hook-associated protein FlgL [Thermodesulfobacteriota bacterium]